MKSTEAACQYMLKMYEVFEDWNLVLAAYNSGPGNVRKRFVKKRQNFLLGNSSVSSERNLGLCATFYSCNLCHGIWSFVRDWSGRHSCVLHANRYRRITKQVHFKQVQEELGDEALMEFLNPQYKYKIVPVISGQNYSLSLPKIAANHSVNQDSITK